MPASPRRRLCLGWAAAMLLEPQAGAVAAAATTRAAIGCCAEPNPQARALLRMLDDSGVERLWQPHTTVDWFSGETRPTARGLHPLASHCSAFAASIATRLRVPLPHPPADPQPLLANRQARWLDSPAGRAAGWQPVSLQQAQERANQGWLVLASAANPDPRRPGHIAVVRPGTPSPDTLQERGPQLTQAGTRNRLRISTAGAFAGHAGAWKPGGSGTLRFYAHAVDWSAADAPRGP